MEEKSLDINKDKNNESFYKNRLPNLLFGLIFFLLVIIAFFNKKGLSSLMFFGVSYVFGVYAYLIFSLIIVLSLYLIIFNKWPKFKANYAGLGLIFLIFFASLASCLNIQELTISNFVNLYTDKINAISHDFVIENLSSITNLQGGFFGYMFTSIFLTGIGKIGSLVIAYLFIFVGLALILVKPVLSLSFFIKEKINYKNENKKEENIKETVKETNVISNNDISSVSPFKKATENKFNNQEFSNDSLLDTKVVSNVVENKNDDLMSSSPFSSNLASSEKPDFKENDDLKVDDKSLNSSLSSPFKEIKSDDSSFKNDSETSSPFSKPKDAINNSTIQPSNQFSNTNIVNKILDDNKDTGHDSSIVNDEEVKETNLQTSFTSSKPSYLTRQEETVDNVKLEEKIENEEKNNVEEDKKYFVEEPSPFKSPLSTGKVIEFNRETYKFPSIDLLTNRNDFSKLEINRQVDEKKKDIINETFKTLGVGAYVAGYHIGPSVTRFDIQREPGVKISEITKEDVLNEMRQQLGGDLSVRIEGVVPGSTMSGLEIGNMAPMMVNFKDVFKEVCKNPDPLTIALGKNISGEVKTISIDQLPHLLIAGTTGSGKSIFVHSIIMTLIMRNYPEDLKFILIDPKKVEFSFYNDMPHLFCPIVTSISQAVATLKKLVSEMERRFSIFSRLGVTKIQDYNKLQENNPNLEKIPSLICVIDEFADMMAQDPKNIEQYTQLIAQKSRASGIYLVISTQRPSVKVITGTIKANITARVALALPMGVDSRTIIDELGAETLLGKGDLLIRTQTQEFKSPTRLQSAYVSNEEIVKVTKFLKSECSPNYNKDFLAIRAEDDITGSLDDINHVKIPGLEDELYEEVKEFVMDNKVASTSLLQRRFGIGYSRAASLLDALQEEGIIKSTVGGRKEVVKFNE